MGLGLNLMLFAIAVSLGASAYGLATGNVAYVNIFFSLFGLGAGASSQALIQACLGFAATLTVVGAITAFIFPNPYAIFQGAFLALLTFLMFPLGMFSSTAAFPDLVKMFFIAFFGVAYVITAISWFKGGSDF